MLTELQKQVRKNRYAQAVGYMAAAIAGGCFYLYFGDSFQGALKTIISTLVVVAAASYITVLLTRVMRVSESR